jgi:hypothetical protein
LTWRWNTIHPFPYNWKTADTWVLPENQEGARIWWANAIYPYVKNWEIYDDSGFPKTVNAADNPDFAIPANAAKARNTLFTYNGFLNHVSSTEIASPSKLPLFWCGFGKSPYAGRGISNPALLCTVTAEPCRFNPTGPPQATAPLTNSGGWFWATGASAYVFGQGMTYSFSDSSAKFRNVGRAPADAANPNRDYNNSPFAQMATGGVPVTMWFCTVGTGTQAAYACLFRPDQEFNLQ